MIWNSATCPAGAPVLAVKFNWTALAVAETGMVTLLPVAGSKLYVAEETRFVKVLVLWLCESTWKVCVRGPQEAAGLSLITSELMSPLAPRSIVSEAG